MELLVFGHAGLPLLVFPTSRGRFFDYEDRGMVGAIHDVIEDGKVQLFCVDSVDAESWYNSTAPPRWRVLRHVQYDRYVSDEVIPFIKERNWSQKLFLTGTSFGGYHAVNYALKHPEQVDRCISLSGAFDIKQFIHGYYDDDCYFNNPVDYLPNLSDEWYLNLYRTKVGFVLVTGERDICLDANLKLSEIFNGKGIAHRLDIWGGHAGHDWPWWHQMIRKHLTS